MTSENLRAWIVANDAPGVELVRCPANTPDVQSSAKALGVAVDDIVKSIVLCCDGAFAVCVTNGTARVDHKKIARRLGVANKRVRLATRDETLAHAGFAPGTVPPFGHRAKLRTFVAIDLATRFDPDDVVYGGGGCVDVEVRCTVRDLLRLTNGEVMDVKRDDDVMNECAADGTRPDVVAGAGSDADAAGDDRALRARRGGAGVATPGDDARVLPVDPALDERVGPARLPIAKRVADVMGRPPEMESEDDVESGEISSSDVRSLAMPAWPAPRPREDDPTAPRAIETAAEVIRVRRVARFLAFATLRPLAPIRVLESDETNGSNPNPNPDASARAGDTKRHELSLPAGTELQLIAGRTLLERRGGEASMERTLRGLRPGAVARVTGRLQANPRPLTVDVVASGVDFVQGNEAVAMLARAMPTPPAGGRDSLVSTVTTVTSDPRVMPPGSPGVTHSSWSRSKRLDKKREKKRLETEARGLGPDTDERYDAEGRRETLRGLRVGERVGKMRKFPPLGSDAVTWVDDARGIDAMRTAVLDPSTRTRDRYDRYDDRYDGAAPDAPWVVGLDAEWRPHKHSPVALLQVATRDEAFLVDVASLMRRDDRYDRYDRYDANAEAFDAFLRDLLDAPDVVRLGFGFEYDLSRLRRSYAGRLSSLDRKRADDDDDSDENRVNEFGETGHALGARVVDVKALALCAFPDKRKLARVGLATLVASVLGAYVDKTEQCSDWERRPLTTDQVEYAAADAHVLTVLFDRCFNHAPDAVSSALADPAALREADERTRSRTGGGGKKKKRATSRGRAAAAESAGRGRDPRSSRRRGRRRAPTRFPRWSGTCSRGGSRWRRRSAAEKAAEEAAARTSAATSSRSSSTLGGRIGGTRTSSGSRRSRVRIPRRAGS